MIDRRSLLLTGLATGACTAAGPVSLSAPRPDLVADLHERSFRFFWDTTDHRTGLALDRWPTPSFSSIAAIGFALTAYPVGVANGWITRAAAAERTRNTLRFLWNLPQGPAPSGTAGYKGFFYHFLDAKTGLRYRTNELSSIDTTLLMGGVLFARAWFDRPDEAEIRDLATKLFDRIEWPFFQDQQAAGDPRLSMGWSPEQGFIPRRWYGYTEAMLAYVMALGSETHGLRSATWDAWTATYGPQWRDSAAGRFLSFGPQFGHQYSHVWVDFRGIRDAPMRAANMDYFENSRRATLAQRAYAVANPMGWRGYGADTWGLTACDGPGDFSATIDGRPRTFFGYAARGPMGQHDERDDGTIAPTAAAASMPFAPEIVEPAIRGLHRDYGAGIWGRYGFIDAFNPTLRDPATKVQKGRIVPGLGWVDEDYLGIDQGPIVAMIENHRSGMVWQAMRGDRVIRRGLLRAGFTGGWLDAR